MAGKFRERDPIFLPSMFVPSLPASGDCFQPAIHDRNIADRKMLVHDLPIFLSSIFLSVLPPETKERRFEEVVKAAEQAAVLGFGLLRSNHEIHEIHERNTGENQRSIFRVVRVFRG